MKRFLILCVALSLAFASQAAEFLYGPYVQALTEDSAYIVWITDKATCGWVEVKGEGEKSAVKYTESHLGLMHNRREHRVPVKNLKPGTTYEYEIFSQEEKGGKMEKPISKSTNAHGNKLTFRTNDRTKDEISFVMVTDIHYNHVGPRHSFVEGYFESFITPEILAGKDFIAFNGDMVTQMANEKSHFEKLFTPLHKLLDTHNTLFYYVRGNHEARGNYAQKFMELYPTWTGMPYYMFRHGPVCFVVIDGGEDKPDSDIEYYGTAAFDLYRENEGKWLQSVIESEEFQTAPYRVILSHIPLNDNSWHGGRHAWKHLCQRCEDKGVNIMISGHTHRYRFNDCGVHNRTFPTLEFSPRHYLDITANSKNLTILVKNGKGEVVDTYTYMPNTK